MLKKASRYKVLQAWMITIFCGIFDQASFCDPARCCLGVAGSVAVLPLLPSAIRIIRQGVDGPLLLLTQAVVTLTTR